MSLILNDLNQIKHKSLILKHDNMTQLNKYNALLFTAKIYEKKFDSYSQRPKIQSQRDAAAL